MALRAMKQERWAESSAGMPSSGRLRALARVWMLLAVAGWATVGAAALLAAAEWRRADQLAQMAGMTAVSGQGVEITISDPRQPASGAGIGPAGHPTHPAPRAAQATQPNQVVTDGDLILLNMLLWYGGARAVAINNQRITAQTTITSSGPVILINGTRLVAPFHVAALGDPDTLKGVLAEAGLIEQMRGAGIAVSMSAQSALRVPPWQPGAEPVH